MEIKQGDKVRVAKDAPKMYARGRMYALITNDCKVEAVEDDNAVISLGRDCFPIPTKYLVKVDAEAFRLADVVSDAGLHQDNYLNEDKKEAKYNVGNWVMISGVFNPQLNGMIGWISRIDKDGNKVSFQDGRFAIVEDKYLTLITQPTEQTKVEKSFEDQLRDVLNGVEHQDYGHPIQAAMISLDINYWDAYAAGLAKEVALQVVHNFGNPKETAEYAVSVAKSVVEGLKGK